MVVASSMGPDSPPLCVGELMVQNREAVEGALTNLPYLSVAMVEEADKLRAVRNKSTNSVQSQAGQTSSSSVGMSQRGGLM